MKHIEKAAMLLYLAPEARNEEGLAWLAKQPPHVQNAVAEYAMIIRAQLEPLLKAARELVSELEDPAEYIDDYPRQQSLCETLKKALEDV
jgi:hypothetical protein